MTATLARYGQPPTIVTPTIVTPTIVTPKAAVLIVDDDASKRVAWRAMIAPSGHEIVEADSGAAAMRCVLEREFAVILLDVRMPVMDGYTTASLIRKHQSSETTPIIFVTAYDRDFAAEAGGYALGGVDFIFAPFRSVELRAKVDVFARQFIQTETLATQIRAAQKAADELRVLTDAAPVGIFQTDIDHRYVYTNPGWSEITGVCAEDARGRDWQTILSVDDRNALVCGPPKVGGFSDRFEIVRPDSTVRTVVLAWRAISDAHNARSGSVGTLSDITASMEDPTLVTPGRGLEQIRC